MEVLQIWAARDDCGFMFYKHKPVRDEHGIWVSPSQVEGALMDFDEPGTFPTITMEDEEPTELQAAVGTMNEVMLGWLEFACAQYSGRTIDNIVENVRARVKWEKEHPMSIDDLPVSVGGKHVDGLDECVEGEHCADCKYGEVCNRG